MNKWNNSTVDAYLRYFGIKSDPVVYEVGSRDGNDGVEIANRISDGHIYWDNIVLFECNPPHIQKIKRNFPKAMLIERAVSDKKGTFDFLQIHGDQNMMGSSTMNTSRNENWIKETSTIKVDTIRLDEAIHILDHKEIDVMKIDIEGYTWEALESLGKSLDIVKVFHLETETKGFDRGKTNLDIAHYMTEKGYRCTALENEWGEHIQDQIWVRL